MGEGTQNQGDTGSQSTSGTQAGDWSQSLAEPLRTPDNLGVLERFKTEDGKGIDVSKMGQSYLEAQRLISQKLPIPNAESTPESWNAFYKAIGRPDKPEDYGIAKPADLPEGMIFDEARAKAFADIAHKSGLPKKAVEAIIGWQHADEVAKFKAAQEAADRFVAESTAAIKKEWGSNYDANLKKADAAIDRIFGPEFKKMLVDTGLGNHPAVVRGIFKAAQALGEHALVQGDGSRQQASTVTREKLISMKQDPCYWDPSRRDPAYVKEVEAANEAYAASL